MHVTEDLNQSRRSETPDPVNADSAKLLGREYFYDGLGRKSGIRYVDKVTNAEVVPTGYREYLTTLSVFSNKLWAGDASALVYSTSPVWVGGQTSCKYDPLGRMLVPCDHSRALSFDGNNVVRTGDDRSNTELGAYSFVHGPGVDDPLLGRKESETVIYVTNGRSEILSYPNANGFESVHRLKDDNPMRVGGIFNAGSFDNQTAGALSAGLSYYRNRFYDAATGRWTQTDPIGIAGGLNQHAYVGNNPASYTDPFGLAPCPPDCGLADAADVGIGFVPVASSIDDAKTLLTGRSLAGSQVGAGGRLVAAVGLLTPIAGGHLRAAGQFLSAAENSFAKAAGNAFQVIVRSKLGKDLASSAHLVERNAAGAVVSRTHRVVSPSGQILHQHQVHIGKYGTERAFPDSWIQFPTVK